MTPPDGQNPVMNMFVWTYSSPLRDGSLENSIPIHEYMHGMSGRLTGGSGQANCLTTTESGGLGEAWSDTMAFLLQRKPGENRTMDVVIGDYSFNNPAGIRSKPYSTDMSRNPYTFSYLKTVNQVHSIGELWAVTMYDMYWNLVDEYGFSENWYDPNQLKGNIITMKLMFGGLKQQPCNPKFLQARDSILASDIAYYNGKNTCLIWKAFAKRGMGVDARQIGWREGFNLPEACGVPPIPDTPPTPPPCEHDKCVVGPALDPACDPCVEKIIEKDPYCGTATWDSICVKQVAEVCGLTCPVA